MVFSPLLMVLLPIFMFDVQRAGFAAEVHGDVECGHLPEFRLLEGEVSA
jgi:hypothetical protein